METSHTWWERTKRNPEAFHAWLRDQYRGEQTAAGRILALREQFAQQGTRAWRVLGVIAQQEQEHARWVHGLLEARGLQPQEKAERYWPHVLSQIGDLETGAAVGAHAERMRLERIEAIASDPESPEDVRRVFQKILPQERFHERAFARLAGTEALARTADAHELGRQALGLAP
ncbi:MAG TPA: ferritin family protein [Myxococcaceae bacterium]|jgi:rubrerythrin